ncbi:MAG: efflux transporter outer membrane subunit [Candidatus Omnitrophica bacterium]|nr:efflux transporter outer membrane subunit [Candidatus Omnitrophota bacterium]
MHRRIVPALLCGLLAGCAIGPNYKKPDVTIPATYRGMTKEELELNQMASLGEQKWWEVFQDKKLQNLIRMALDQNYDLRIAADHVLEAQAQLNISGSYQYPTITAVAGPNGQRYEKIRTTNPYAWGAYLIEGSFAWDLDFWGKYRRMIEASKANLLASQWARLEVIATLIADVANSYFQLRELDIELEISKRTLASRQEFLKLIKHLADHGSSSMLDVRQAEQLVFTAAENIPDLQRRIQQQENLISILLGNNPGSIERGWSLIQQPHAPVVPAGIPSSLLLRRPDIQEAEQQLVAFNAQIGVAQGAYFPDISLTASGGYQSAALSKLFTGPSGMWDIASTLTQPIFNAGRIRAGVKFAQAQQQEALHFYQKTIQQAFREVSDSLIAYRKDQEFRTQQELLTQAASDALRLSELRYKGGSSSYLEVLDSNTRYFSAQLGLAQARLSELRALVDLYKVLGGGWQFK